MGRRCAKKKKKKIAYGSQEGGEGGMNLLTIVEYYGFPYVNRFLISSSPLFFSHLESFRIVSNESCLSLLYALWSIKKICLQYTSFRFLPFHCRLYSVLCCMIDGISLTNFNRHGEAGSLLQTGCK